MGKKSESNNHLIFEWLCIEKDNIYGNGFALLHHTIKSEHTTYWSPISSRPRRWLLNFGITIHIIICCVSTMLLLSVWRRAARRAAPARSPASPGRRIRCSPTATRREYTFLLMTHCTWLHLFSLSG